MLAARRVTAAFSLALCSLAGSALAMPAIMDRLPADAAITVVVPSVEQLEKDIKAVAELIGQPLPIGIEALVSQVGITSGFNKAGSMVIVMPELPVDGGEQQMLFMVPTSDYAGLLKGFEVKPSGGVDEVQLPTGEPGFVKSLDGGYAVVGGDKGVVEKFTGAGGSAAKFEAMVGDAGKTLGASGDFFIVVNVDKIRPVLKEGFDNAMKEMVDQMAMMGGGDVEQMNPEAAKWMGEMFISETKSIVASVNIDTMGVSLDLGANFNAGSRLAKVTAAAGNSSALLAKLPAGPYLLAAAIDSSAPGFKEFIKAMPKPKNPSAPGMDFGAGLEKVDGASVVVGIPAGGLMGGLLTRTVSYTATSDYPGAVGEMKKALGAMKDAKIGDGKFTEGGAEVDGKKLDVWEMRVNADPDNPQMVQMMMGLFGPAGGPNGYMASVDGGYITTYSKSSELAGLTLKAVQGQGTLSGEDKVLAQVAGKLPRGRSAEFYVGIKGILDSVMPMVPMITGRPIRFDMPPTIPPVAGAITPQNGGAVASIYLPNATIKTVAGLIKAFEEAGNQEDEENEPMGGDEKKGDKPGF
jgi:hypothetical protein